MYKRQVLLEEKKPVKEIATRLGRSYKCLYNHIKGNGVYKLSGGRPISFFVRTKRQIVREITNVTVIKQLSLSVSDQTIYNFLHSEGYKFAPALKCPFLNEDNKGRRLCWAEGLLEKLCLKQLNVNNITFVDEKRFLLDEPEVLFNRHVMKLNLIQNLIASFPKRLIEVVKAKGGNLSLIHI